MKKFKTISQLEILSFAYYELMNRYVELHQQIKKYGYTLIRARKFEKVQNQLREINQAIIELEEKELKKLKGD